MPETFPMESRERLTPSHKFSKWHPCDCTLREVHELLAAEMLQRPIATVLIEGANGFGTQYRRPRDV